MYFNKRIIGKYRKSHYFMNKKIYLYNNINKMKWLYIFFFITPCLSFLSGTRKLNILDKSHVKNYVDSWIDIWKTVPTPISDLRINEAIFEKDDKSYIIIDFNNQIRESNEY